MPLNQKINQSIAYFLFMLYLLFFTTVVNSAEKSSYQKAISDCVDGDATLCLKLGDFSVSNNKKKKTSLTFYELACKHGNLDGCLKYARDPSDSDKTHRSQLVALVTLCRAGRMNDCQAGLDIVGDKDSKNFNANIASMLIDTMITEKDKKITEKDKKITETDEKIAKVNENIAVVDKKINANEEEVQEIKTKMKVIDIKRNKIQKGKNVIDKILLELKETMANVKKLTHRELCNLYLCRTYKGEQVYQAKSKRFWLTKDGRYLEPVK